MFPSISLLDVIPYNANHSRWKTFELTSYRESFQRKFHKASHKVLYEQYNRKSFPANFQQDVATEKVFHHERFALYGIYSHLRVHQEV